MTRARLGSWTLGVVVLWLFVSRSVTAIGPAAIVVHGGGLQAPIVVRPEIGSFVFMWGGGTRHYDNQSGALPSGLDDRRYVDYDVFWGRFEAEELKPEAASQHGRVYLPTADQPAAVVLTPPVMTNSEPSATRARATPIPSEMTDFVLGRVLMPCETSGLLAAGGTDEVIWFNSLECRKGLVTVGPAVSSRVDLAMDIGASPRTVFLHHPLWTAAATA